MINAGRTLRKDRNQEEFQYTPAVETIPFSGNATGSPLRDDRANVKQRLICAVGFQQVFHTDAP